MAFETETTWFNPTDVDVTFKLLDDVGAFVDVKIPSKSEMKIPTKFDLAVREDRDGTILGLAPQLVKGGKPIEQPTPKKPEKAS
jgi:hypothetical protein